MPDYSQSPYKPLFAYIENGCKRMNEKRDFLAYLRSMEQAASIEQLVSIYNNIYKLLAVLILGTTKLPFNWYVKDTLGIGNAYLFEELCLYFNDNILRLFKSYKYPSLMQSLACLANLRGESDEYEIAKFIMEHTNCDDRSSLSLINSARIRHYRQRNRIEKKSFYSRNFNVILYGYIKDSKLLAAHHRIFDVAEIGLGKDNGFTYEGMAEQYVIVLENEKKRIEIERKRAIARRREEAMMRKSSWEYGGNSTGVGDIFTLFFGFTAEIITHLIRGR